MRRSPAKIMSNLQMIEALCTLCEEQARVLRSAVRWFGERAAQITKRSASCINESDAWGFGVQDLLGLAYWHQDLPEQALACGEAALALSPDDRRLRDNVKYYRAAVAQR